MQIKLHIPAFAKIYLDKNNQEKGEIISREILPLVLPWKHDLHIIVDHWGTWDSAPWLAEQIAEEGETGVRWGNHDITKFRKQMYLCSLRRMVCNNISSEPETKSLDAWVSDKEK